MRSRSMWREERAKRCMPGRKGMLLDWDWARGSDSANTPEPDLDA